MKRTILLTLVSILTTIQATAQLANGFYRVQNNASSRYITLQDDQVGEIDYSSTNVDLSNIVTWRGFDYVKNNPASIIYVEQHGTEYDLKVQGTSIYQITGNRKYLGLRAKDGGTYIMYIGYQGTEYRLYDSSTDDDEGYVSYKKTGEGYQNWKFVPVDTESNYIGLKPTVQVGDSYYGTLYANYSFKVASEGICVYVVDGVKEGAFQLQEITDEIKPGQTPLLFKCSSSDPAQNKIIPVADIVSGPDNNKMGGTYFARITGHKVNVRYDETTMRVLGKNADGELAFITGSKENLTKSHYIPANTCWLNVPTGLTGDFKYVSREDYATGIRDVKTDSKANSTDDAIYTLTGTRTSDKNLRPGIYIQNGKKLVIK